MVDCYHWHENNILAVFDQPAPFCRRHLDGLSCGAKSQNPGELIYDIAKLRHEPRAALLEELLRNTGFEDVQVKTIARTIKFTDGESFLRLNTMAFVGMSAARKAMGDNERKRVMEAIISESVPVLQQYSDGSELAFELRTNLATASL